MDGDSNQMEQHPVQCRNGCGFYGNAGTDGLCSVCYKEAIKKKQQPPSNMPTSLAQTSSSSPTQTTPIMIETASPTVFLPIDKRAAESDCETLEACVASAQNVDDHHLDVPHTSSCPSSSTSSICSQESDGHKDGKKKKNRCFSCKKKVGLTGFTCRCGGLFCSIHRYSDKHDCNFDYKELGAEEIRRSNPVVVAAKVQKI